MWVAVGFEGADSVPRLGGQRSARPTWKRYDKHT
jgi:hypothetical protein